MENREDVSISFNWKFGSCIFVLTACMFRSPNVSGRNQSSLCTRLDFVYFFNTKFIKIAYSTTSHGVRRSLCAWCFQRHSLSSSIILSSIGSKRIHTPKQKTVDVHIEIRQSVRRLGRCIYHLKLTKELFFHKVKNSQYLFSLKLRRIVKVIYE